MLNKIKELADDAIKLQNKAHMEKVLRDIIVICIKDVEVSLEKEKAIIKKQSKGKADE